MSLNLEVKRFFLKKRCGLTVRCLVHGAVDGEKHGATLGSEFLAFCSWWFMYWRLLIAVAW